MEMENSPAEATAIAINSLLALNTDNNNSPASSPPRRTQVTTRSGRLLKRKDRVYDPEDGGTQPINSGEIDPDFLLTEENAGDVVDSDDYDGSNNNHNNIMQHSIFSPDANICQFINSSQSTTTSTQPSTQPPTLTPHNAFIYQRKKRKETKSEAREIVMELMDFEGELEKEDGRTYYKFVCINCRNLGRIEYGTVIFQKGVGWTNPYKHLVRCMKIGDLKVSTVYFI